MTRRLSESWLLWSVLYALAVGLLLSRSGAL